MPLEIEQKFRVADHLEVRKQLAKLGAESRGEVEQCDRYFAHPARDFRQTGEALRVRRTGEQAVVTYKGPKLDAVVKTRREIELPLAAPSGEFAELLQVLGFVPVAEVKKKRDRFTIQKESVILEVALDTVDRVGTFVEVEAIAEQQEMNLAQQAVVQLAEQLGLAELETRSYLRMLLEQ